MFPLPDELFSLALNLAIIKYQRPFRMSIPGNRDFSYLTKHIFQKNTPKGVKSSLKFAGGRPERKISTGLSLQEFRV
jgi:hypothetical protein